MAIRLRRIKRRMIALCAAETVARRDDIYLSDEIHHALTMKFWEDFAKEGRMEPPPTEEPEGE